MLYRVSLILALVVALLFIGCESSQKKVLLILRESVGSTDKQSMGTTKAVEMKSMIEQAGFEVVIASASGRTFSRVEETLESDLTLDKVKIADYVGFIIPCMSLGTPTVKPEEVAMAKKLVTETKPVAAQRKGVIILAQAGALKGKRYSYASKPTFIPGFEEAIYGGEGVVQDGNIITSSYCPAHGSLDQTMELTQAFIAELQK